MPIILADVFGSPNIGVYCFANESIAIVPPGLTQRKISQFAETLGVHVCNTTIGGSSLVGALVTGNSNAILVPHTIRDYELSRIQEISRVVLVDSKWTALGNVVLANDSGALIHPSAGEELIRAVSDELKLQATRGTLGSLPFVGALGIATNKGAMLSPNTLEQERVVARAALHVEAELSSTNGGVPFVKSGILANSKGAVVGPLTRGAELMQISKTLGV
ncbi:MAG TPA: translation initiation factor IF-6 [Candidatus Dormibacteraeota bacterium]|nr:translation initiation factor IF-6 [Candidatus Dormibacteraeota bacterium]